MFGRMLTPVILYEAVVWQVSPRLASRHGHERVLAWEEDQFLMFLWVGVPSVLV